MYFSLYKYWAKKILKSIGNVYRTDDPYNDRSPIEQACEYNGFGLKIISSGLPEYVDPDKTKEYIKNIEIYYLGRLVYDSTSEELCVEGKWEEILKELYNKHEVIKEQMEERKRNYYHAKKIYEDIIKPLLYHGARRINDYIEIKSQCVKTYKTNNCGTFIDNISLYVICNGQKVFSASRDEDCSEYSGFYYEDGYWIYEMQDYLEELKRQEKREEDKKGEEYLKKLRKI